MRGAARVRDPREERNVKTTAARAGSEEQKE